MKILHIAASYKPAYVYGGPVMSVSMLCEQLVKAGHEVQVYTTTANGPTELDVDTGKAIDMDGVMVTYFKRYTKDHSHFSPALLKAVYKNAKTFDAVHVHAWWNTVSVLACIAALKRKVPVVISPRGTLSSYSFQNKNASVKSLICRISIPYFKKSHFHATSAYEQDAIAGWLLPKSITCIANFVKLPPLIGTNVLNNDSAAFKLLFFSRIEEKKGLDILISSLQHIKSPYHLTIAGDGNPAYISGLKALALQLGVADKITWAGFVNNKKFNLLRQHNLFVLPSYDENFGNAVIESLSTGTAVLISKGVGLAAYVNNHKLGWVCQAEPLSVGNAIDHIINTQAHELGRIRHTAPAIIYNDFEAAAIVKKYITMYRQILST